MKKYRIWYEYIAEDEVEVEADSEDEAIAMVCDIDDLMGIEEIDE